MKYRVILIVGCIPLGAAAMAARSELHGPARHSLAAAFGALMGCALLLSQKKAT